MANKNPPATQLIKKALHDIQEVKAQLHEYRYCLEKNVEQRTAHLQKRIASLESRNAKLCDNLTSVYEQIAALKRESESPADESGRGVRGARLYLVSSQPSVGTSAEDTERNIA